MRPVYLILRILLPYAFTIFFRRRNNIFSQRKLKAQTIFVSNHPSAFIDPLVAANSQWPIIFFMTRSDVFKKWLQPVTWASHMVPIYRADRDGAGTYEKNKKVFSGVAKVLKRKKSVILFGEGYTDDTFIRSLKPMKKGAARLGLGTMDSTDWEHDIKIQPIGLNYSDPSVFRSDTLLVCGDLIFLKDYEKAYKENPAKTVNDLTKDIGEGIKKNITYIEDKKLADFLEHILILSRRGMNAKEYNAGISMEQRYRYSQKVANTINENYSKEDPKWLDLKNETDQYFDELEKESFTETQVNDFHKAGNKKSLIENFLFLTFLFPLFLVGLVHSLVPYLIVKTMVEKMFKRKVFWSGVKIMMGGLFFFLYNLPIFWILPKFLPADIGRWPAYFICLAYFLIVPAFTFIWAYKWRSYMRDTLKLIKADKTKLKKYSDWREKLKAKLPDFGF